eukprot:GEMP01032015.1.p1 GENE.GEMP01032015.1~~GEMP01032015.1.p1  ORF type:complete len:653 (+),score=92.00 GEMP01032015.1:147-2105(+)
MVSFLNAVSACFAIAFLSYYLQFPGLFGVDGMQPTQGLDDHKLYLRFPSLLSKLTKFGYSTDALLELFAIIGLVISLVGTTRFTHETISIAQVLIYLSLYLSGQRFLSFQWDIFLIEVGFIAILFHHTVARGSPAPHAQWVARGMFVKFLLMTAYVKTTAGCNTWSSLTAAEYHMASQCLPTASAWWFHQFPPFLSRLSIAIMFVIQGPALMLLLAPIRAFRQVGAAAQLFLQVMIALTGNYNWFNLLTAAMLIPCAARDIGGKNGRETTQISWHYHIMLHGLACAMICGAFTHMYDVEYTDCPSIEGGPFWLPDSLWSDCWKISSRYTVNDVVQFTKTYLTYGPTMQFLLLAWSIVKSTQLETTLHRRFITIAHGIACMFFLAIGFLPWDHVIRGGADFVGKQTVQAMYSPLEAFHMSSSYGLFRRMTGVGRDLGNKWGGLPTPNVEVPAVIVEGYDGNTWHEIEFRYAPGREDKMPVQTAPHQPRLDWQMWFAALGSYQHNDWFIHLVYKLLQGAPHHDQVLELLDHPVYPFVKKPPKKMRAWLYHYDFTRLRTPWNAPHKKSSLVSIASKRWWSRTRVREYLPEVNLVMLQNLATEQKWNRAKPERCSLGKLLDIARNFVPRTTGFWIRSYFVDTPFLLCVGVTLGIFK